MYLNQIILVTRNQVTAHEHVDERRSNTFKALSGL